MIVLTVCWRKFGRQENSPPSQLQRKMSAQELGNFCPKVGNFTLSLSFLILFQSHYVSSFDLSYGYKRASGLLSRVKIEKEFAQVKFLHRFRHCFV